MRAFLYDQPATRVIFGAGAFDRLAEEVGLLGARRALVLATPGQRSNADEAARRLGDVAVGIYADAVMHVPIETARAAARRGDGGSTADCCVAIGGGSTIGLGKAIALESAAADPRRAHDLRRLRDDADLRSHRGRPQEDRDATAKVLPKTVHLRSRR